MAQKLIDLSDLLAEDKQVRLSQTGPVYTLPGDIPAELFLRIQVEAQRQVDALQAEDMSEMTAATRDLLDQILKLFQYGDPSMTELPGEASLVQLVQLIDRVYGSQSEAGPVEGGERPSSGGTRSSSSKGRTKSRSSTSSRR
jgi:hypothetical protein